MRMRFILFFNDLIALACDGEELFAVQYGYLAACVADRPLTSEQTRGLVNT